MSEKGRKPARARAFTMLIAGIVAGSLLSGPAVAHTGRRIPHLQGHLDPIYLNESQKAADADTLDNIDSAAFLQGASTLAGIASCPGASFYPEDGDSPWVTNSSGRREGNVDTYRCAIDLPHGAAVTGVSFTLNDAAPADVTDCTLTRTDLTVPIADEDAVSNPTGSTGTGGAQTVTGTIIAANAVIDNVGRAYSLLCTLGGTDLGILGSSVTYTVTASAG